MPPSSPGNSRARQRRRTPVRRPAPRFVPHGPGGQMLRPAPRPAPRVLPRSFRSDAASGGRAQIERANRYKRTRRYYNDYRAAFRQNPNVKRATGQIRKGSQTRRAARGTGAANQTAANRTARRLISQGVRAYEREQRRGPDQLSNQFYGRYGERLWKRAERFYGPGAKPRLVVDYDPKMNRRANAWVNSRERDLVHVNPRIARELMNPKRSRLQSESVLLHEWTHTRQPEKIKHGQAEGEAEAMQQLLAKRLGKNYVQGTAEYEWLRKRSAPKVAAMLHMKALGTPPKPREFYARIKPRRARPLRLRKR